MTQPRSGAVVLMASNDPRTLPARVRSRFETLCGHLHIEPAPVMRQFESRQYPQRDLLEMDGWPDATVEAHIRAQLAEIAEAHPPAPPRVVIDPARATQAADDPPEKVEARVHARLESVCAELGFAGDEAAEVLAIVSIWRFTPDELRWLDSLLPGPFGDVVRELSCEALGGYRPGSERLPTVMQRLWAQGLAKAAATGHRVVHLRPLAARQGES